MLENLRRCVGLRGAGHFGLRAHVEVTDARTNDARTLFLCFNQPVGMIRT
jgi:hypothetical protein